MRRESCWRFPEGDFRFFFTERRSDKSLWVLFGSCAFSGLQFCMEVTQPTSLLLYVRVVRKICVTAVGLRLTGRA
jgi:hypothetical protein